MEGTVVAVPSDKELYEKYSRVLPKLGPGPGACIDTIGKDQVPESMVCRYFGQKSSKSGWKYNCKQTPEDASAIYDLWQRVYDECLMPNREISLQFARGIILQSQDIPVNWIEFAVGREKYRTRLTSGKNVSSGKKVEVGKKIEGVENVGSGNGRVSILGKRRYMPSTPLPLIKLKVKEEVLGEEVMHKECVRSVTKTKGSRFAGFFPNWEATELSNMVGGIAEYEKLTSQLKSELHAYSTEKDTLEVEARRANMQLSDRLTLLEQAKLEVDNLCAEEANLNDETKREELRFNIAFNKRTVSHSSEIVVGCQVAIAAVESRLVESSRKFTEVADRVSSLEYLLGSLNDLLGRMQQGSGNTFYPRPIFSNPECAISTIHHLNACPVCGLWYSCNNFVSLGCGHTYHHWCLSEHAQKSHSCRIEFCKEPLMGESAIAIGIRPLPMLEAFVAASIKTDALTLVDSKGTEEQFLSVQESGSCSGNDKAEIAVQPLSQASKTNEVSTTNLAMLVASQCTRSSCLVCKTTEASVILKDCGHDVFCFSCIQGLKACPLCKAEIAGWEPVKSKTGVSPMLLSLGNELDSALDPLISRMTAKKRTKVKVDAVVSKESTSIAVVLAIDSGVNKIVDISKDADVSEDDDDQGRGLIHWCSQNEFLNGGSRSVSNDTELNDLFADPIQREDEPASRAKRIRMVKTLKDLNVICSDGPTIKKRSLKLDKIVKEVVVGPSNLRKKPGCLSIASKAIVQNVPVSTIITSKGQQSRTITRTSNTRNLVPVKFRGLD